MTNRVEVRLDSRSGTKICECPFKESPAEVRNRLYNELEGRRSGTKVCLVCGGKIAELSVPTNKRVGLIPAITAALNRLAFVPRTSQAIG